MHYLDSTLCRTLANGMELCLFPHGGSMAEIRFLVATGSMHEREFLGCGLSHFLEHMLFQGCQGFPSHRIAEEVARCGGDVNAYTSRDHTCYHMQLPKEHWQYGAGMLAAMVRFPELPEARFVKERDVILRECDRCGDQVESRIFNRMMAELFRGQPLSHPVIGYRERIASVTADMARTYHARRYQPHRIKVIAVGDVEPEAFFERIEALCGEWQDGDLAETVLPAAPACAAREAELYFPDPAARLLCAFHAPAPMSPELPAVDLLTSMSGNGENSLLSQALVLRNPLALDVAGFCMPAGQGCVGCLMAEAEERKLNTLADNFRRGVEAIAAGQFSAARLAREKSQIYADRLRSLREIGNIATEIGTGLLYHGDCAAGDRYLTHLEALTADEVRSAAAEYLDGGRLFWLRQVTKKPKAAIVRKFSSPAMTTPEIPGAPSILYVPDHQLPLAGFSLILPGGGIFEPEGLSGAARLSAALLTAGCRTRSEAKILDRFDQLGAEFSASAGANSFAVEVTAPRRHFAAVMELLAEILSEPLFPDSAFQRERCRIVEALKVRGAHPVKAAMDRASQMLFGHHPYASGGRGEIAALNAMTSADVAAFYRHIWSRKASFCGFCGDCSESDAEKFGKLLASALPWQDAEPLLPPPPQFPAVREECVFTLPREQSVVIRALPGVSIGDAASLDAFDILLRMENGLNSHLFSEIREKRALSYSVGCTYSSGFHSGAFFLYALTAPGAADEVAALLDAEVEFLLAGEYSQQQFDSARFGAVQDARHLPDLPETLLRSGLLELFYRHDPQQLLHHDEALAGFSRETFDAALHAVFADPAGGALVKLLPEQ